MIIGILCSQDDRSPLSSGESSDESSSVEVAGPSHLIQEQIVRRQRQTHQQQQQQQQQQSQHSPTPANKKQDTQQQPQSIQVRDELGKAFANNSNLNSLLYQSPLVNLPHEVLMNLVQEGNLILIYFEQVNDAFIWDALSLIQSISFIPSRSVLFFFSNFCNTN